MTLAEFLLARIAEDEEVANRAAAEHAAPWGVSVDRTAPEGWEHLRVVVCEDGLGDVTDRIYPELADHIVRHDPARVLAECEAKRRIVERYQDRTKYQTVVADAQSAAEEYEDYVLPLLALPYADHPEFREEW